MKLLVKTTVLLTVLLGSVGCDAAFDIEGRFWDTQGKRLKNCWADVYILPEDEYFSRALFLSQTIAGVVVGPPPDEYSFILHCPEKHTTISKGPFLFIGNYGGNIPVFDVGDVVFPR